MTASIHFLIAKIWHQWSRKTPRNGFGKINKNRNLVKIGFHKSSNCQKVKILSFNNRVLNKNLTKMKSKFN